MKKIIVPVIGLFVLLGGGVLWATLNADKLAKSFKPDLEKIASDALDAKVTLGELDASLLPTAKIVADSMSVRPKDGSTEGISFDNFTLKVQLLALLGGKLDITQISLVKPEIKLIKTKHGVHIDGLPAPRKPKKSKKKKEAKKKNSDAPQESSPEDLKVHVPVGLGLNLRALEINSAKLTFSDPESNASYSINDLDFFSSISIGSDGFTLDGLSITAPTANANGSSIPLALNIRGDEVHYELASGDFNLPKLSIGAFGNDINITGKLNALRLVGDITVGSPGINLANYSELKAIIPALETLNLQGSAAPDLKVNLKGGGNFDAKGGVTLKEIGCMAGPIPVSQLNGAINLTASPMSQVINSKDLKLNLGSNPATIEIAASNSKSEAKLEKLVAKAFSGEATITGGMKYADKQPFSGEVNVSGMQLEPMVQVVAPDTPATLTGRLESFRANVKGILGAEDLMQALAGKAAISLKDGELKGKNLAGKTLLAITDLPFLSDSLYSRVPEDQREELQSDRTAIDSLTGDFRIGSGALHTNNLQLVSTIFQIDSKGKIGLDSQLDLKSDMIYSRLFSAGMVEATKELAALLDDQDRLLFPLDIEGTASSPSILPDMEHMLKLIAKNTLEEEAGELVGELLGGGGKKGKKSGLGGLLGF